MNLCQPARCAARPAGLLLALALALICGSSVTPARAAEPLTPLKVALLPILDAFPFHVARRNGYFDDAGVHVQAVPVGSGLERDQLMQAGAVDGMLNEIASTAGFNRDAVQMVIVATARKAYPDSPLFRLLAAPDSGLRTPADLAGVPIGVSMNTIIEYVTDRLMTAKGVDPAAVVKKSVPVIPERYQLLLQGQLKAATLPDPLAKSALAAGAVGIVDDSEFPRYAVSVLTFSAPFLKSRPEAVRGFLKAWDRAAAEINADPEKYRPLLLQEIRVPENIRQTYRIPVFPRGEIPTEAQWRDMLEWMAGKGLLAAPLPYAGSVSADFLP